MSYHGTYIHRWRTKWIPLEDAEYQHNLILLENITDKPYVFFMFCSYLLRCWILNKYKESLRSIKMISFDCRDQELGYGKCCLRRRQTWYLYVISHIYYQGIVIKMILVVFWLVCAYFVSVVSFVTTKGSGCYSPYMKESRRYPVNPTLMINHVGNRLWFCECLFDEIMMCFASVYQYECINDYFTNMQQQYIHTIIYVIESYTVKFIWSMIFQLTSFPMTVKFMWSMISQLTSFPTDNVKFHKTIFIWFVWFKPCPSLQRKFIRNM